MNKYDYIVISIVIIISILLLVIININNNNYAYVYYDNNLIKTIDLKKDNEYKVNGYNGEVIINVKDNKLKVIKEDSPLHICSKSNYTNSGIIACLPNKIIIKFNDELDARAG